VPVGPVTLTARNSLAGWLEGPTLDVRLGEVTTGDITYQGPDLSRRIEVSTFCRPYHILSGRDERVRLTGPGIDATTERTPGTSQSFAFDDLGPGPYTLTVEHELFETVVREGLEPGQRVKVDLVPNAHLGLAVTDAITGEPIEAARLQLRLDDFPHHSPNAFLIHAGALPADGMLPPIVPGNTTLIVEAEGYALCELPVLALAPFETRAVSAALTPEAGLAGTVRWSTGEPASDVQLLLMRPGEAPAPHQSWFDPDGARTEGAQHETHTDADGRYAFRGLTPGTFDVHAVGTAWLTAGTNAVEVRGGVQQDLDLTLPAGASLRLQITDLDPVPEGFEVAVVASVKRLVTDGPFGEMGPYGSMRIGLTRGEGTTWVGQHLPAGLTKVVIGRHEMVIPTKGGGSYEYGEQRVLDEVELQDGRTSELVTALGDALPGTLHVEVLKDGLPQPGVRVRVDGVDSIGGTAQTGRAGIATITGLFPGEFRVRAILPSSGEFKARAGVLVEAGQTGQIRIETGTVLGYVRVLGPSGQPLVEKHLSFTSSAMDHRAKTDADGRAQVRLVPGVVRVELRELDKQAMQWVHWRGELAWPGGNSSEPVTVQLVEL
ncbi:MAG: carboxypeptidase-like regulatory domain-containing protein, partial [Planctomycetota bacterium]|nr:carboxypeptidase-like regulatory domain-containing protein [Planctomycetota bacterium]